MADAEWKSSRKSRSEDGVHAVRRHGREAELPGDGFAVHRVGHAGECSAAEREHVGPGAGLPEALCVPAEHLEVGQHVVGEEHGLGPLEMRVARHHGVGVSFGQPDQRDAQPVDSVQDVADGLLHVQAHVDGDLVVARPRRVELPSRLADRLEQPALDVHVDVFELGPPGEVAVLDPLADGHQPVDDGRSLVIGDDPLPAEHPGVRDRARDVLAVQPAVVVDRYGVGRGDVVHRHLLGARLLAAVPADGVQS